MSCVEQTKGKYVARKPDGSFKRKGPPYPANECCGETKKGNDGLMYKSVPNKKGVCRWVKHDVQKKSPKKKPTKKSPKKKPAKKSPKKKPEKKYKLVSDNMCGKMPKTLKMKKLTKVCVEVLSGTNKGKHKWVTQSAAEKGLGGPIPVKWLRAHAAKHYEDNKKKLSHKSPKKQPAKKSPKKKPAQKSPKKLGCVEQTKGKYVARKPDGSFKRKGPPYPANDCCGETKKGNNGLMYKSERNKKGVCTWKKIKSPKKKPAKQSPKRKPVTPPQQKIELLEKELEKLRGDMQKLNVKPIPKHTPVKEVALTPKDFNKISVMRYKELRPREVQEKPQKLDKYIGWYASEKIDGWHAIWDGKGTLYTKSYKKTFAVPEKWMRLLPNIPLTGEIKIKGKSATKTASLMKSNPMWEETYFHVFDVIGKHIKKPFYERVNIVEKAVESACKNIPNCPLIAAPQIIMKSRDDILSFYKKVLKKHGEGLVITHPDSKYDVSDKRSGERVKLKGRNDAEGVVVGHIMGGSRGFKSLDVSYNGTTFHLGIGFNFEQRDNYKKLFPLGTIVTFSYRGLGDGGRPKEARFVRVRGDL